MRGDHAQGGIPVVPGKVIDDIDRCAGSTEIDPTTIQLQIMPRITARRQEVPVGPGDMVFEQGLREGDAPVVLMYDSKLFGTKRQLVDLPGKSGCWHGALLGGLEHIRPDQLACVLILLPIFKKSVTI